MKSELLRTFRGLRRRWIQTISIVSLLGVGIGVTTTVVGVADGVLFRPLPYQRPHDLAQLESFAIGSTRSGAILRYDFEAIRTLTGGVVEIGLISAGPALAFQSLAAREEVESARVTPSIFQLLGVPFSIGRSFMPADDSDPQNPAVITWACWKRRFDGDPAVVGRTILLGGQATRIVGVLPQEFVFPVATTAKAEFVTVRRLTGSPRDGEIVSTPIVRLRSGMTLLEGQRLIDSVLESGSKASRVRLTPLSYSLFSFPPRILWALLATAFCMLLGICANVTALLIAGHRERQGDFELQMVLGCGRPRLIRLLGLEVAILSLGAVAVGVSAASLAADWMLSTLPDAYVNFVPPTVPKRIVLIGLSVAAVAGLTCGVVASVRMLWVTGRTGTRPSFPTRPKRGVVGAYLVATQAAAAVIVLGVGSLLMAHVLRLKVADLGYDPQGTYAITFSSRPGGGTDLLRQRDSLLSAVRALPRVEGAGIADTLPMNGEPSIAPPMRLGDRHLARWEVSAGFLQAVAARFRLGRDFTDDEVFTDRPVAILNGAAAAALWPDQSPIGQVLPASMERQFTVVGVVDNLLPGYSASAEPAVYVPLRRERDSHSVLVVKSTLTSSELDKSAREAFAAAGSTAILSRPEKIVRILNRGIEEITFPSLVVSMLALVAWLAALCGVCGLSQRWVVAESRNIGLRLAVGATPHHVRLFVSKELLWPVGIGASIGSIAVMSFGSSAERLFFDTSQAQGLTTLIAVALMLGAAFVVVEFVCRRATKCQPVTLLKGGTG